MNTLICTSVAWIMLLFFRRLIIALNMPSCIWRERKGFFPIAFTPRSGPCAAMEMGAAAIMANTALATSGNLPLMAEAFKLAIEAGRKAYLAKTGAVQDGASASSPLTGFLRD